MNKVWIKRRNKEFNNQDTIEIHNIINVMRYSNEDITIYLHRNNLQSDKVHITYNFNPTKNLVKYIRKIDIGLPEDVNWIISTFIDEHYYIDLHIIITYPELYPFRPPIWSLDACTTNLKTSKNITSYCLSNVKNHNYLYSDQYTLYDTLIWSPNISIEQDILNFMLMNKYFYKFIM
jgi:hypothetical protein